MHKFFNITIKGLGMIILSLFTITLVSCNTNKNTYLNDSIAIAYKNEVPYLVNSKNETYSLSKYDLIVPYFDDILIVGKNNKFGYIKKNGEVLIEPKFDEAYPFSEGKAIVRQNNVSKIIDENENVLFELESDYRSISSFSNNLLVISNNTKQGYLKYDPDIDEFYYLFNIKEKDESNTETLNHFPYDYCGQFKNEYAVVGFYNTDGQYKYSHINVKGERLYDYEWDYAGDYSEGYAVVGNNMTYSLKLYCDKERQFDSVLREQFGHKKLSDYLIPKLYNMTYMYISSTGRYLGKEKFDTTTGKTIIEPYLFAQASAFKDSMAIVSDLCCLVNTYSAYGWNYSSTKYFNNYAAIDCYGNRILTSPMGYKNYWGNGIVCSYTDIVSIDGIYILSFRSYDYQSLYYNDDESAIGTFATVPIIIKNDEYWIKDYLNLFTNGKVTPEYVKDHATPYYQSLFKMSKYAHHYLAKAQISSGFKDSCGLMQLSIVDNLPVITYIIPPLYDNIIF